MKQIQELPLKDKTRLEKMVRETQERHDKIQDSAKRMQELLDHFRLSIKYLVFDLEATRRENQQLRDTIQKYGLGEGDSNAD